MFIGVDAKSFCCKRWMRTHHRVSRVLKSRVQDAGVSHSNEPEKPMKVGLWTGGHPKWVKPGDMDLDERGS